MNSYQDENYLYTGIIFYLNKFQAQIIAGQYIYKQIKIYLQKQQLATLS